MMPEEEEGFCDDDNNNNKNKNNNNTSDNDDDGTNNNNNISFSVYFGRACGYCLLNHYDIPVFILSFAVLFLSVNSCCYCVVVVAILCALLCLRFPILNAPLWSSLIVLYFHKDWNVNFGNIQVHWNRQ